MANLIKFATSFCRVVWLRFPFRFWFQLFLFVCSFVSLAKRQLDLLKVVRFHGCSVQPLLATFTPTIRSADRDNWRPGEAYALRSHRVHRERLPDEPMMMMSARLESSARTPLCAHHLFLCRDRQSRFARGITKGPDHKGCGRELSTRRPTLLFTSN